MTFAELHTNLMEAYSARLLGYTHTALLPTCDFGVGASHCVVLPPFVASPLWGDNGLSEQYRINLETCEGDRRNKGKHLCGLRTFSVSE